MAIKIIPEPDLYLTEKEYAYWKQEYERAMMMYAGKPITLEEFIRSRRSRRRGAIHES